MYCTGASLVRIVLTGAVLTTHHISCHALQAIARPGICRDVSNVDIEASQGERAASADNSSSAVIHMLLCQAQLPYIKHLHTAWRALPRVCTCVF